MAKQPLIETADLNIKLEAATEEINLFPENDAEEKHSIIQALKTSHGSRKQAAGILHIDPSTLYRKMKKYGMTNNRHSIFLFGIKCLHLHMIGNPCNIGMTVTT